jgi:molybdenum cofactor synthesis domain-containing protein
MHIFALTPKDLFAGQEAWLGPQGQEGWDLLYSGDADIRLGSLLTWEGGKARVTDKKWTSGGMPEGVALKLSALKSCAFAAENSADVKKDGYSLAWITLSDKGAKGQREDRSGPLVREMAGQVLPLSLVRGFVLPDDPGLIKALLSHLCLFLGVDVVLTTGGTGLSPRDFTPEATAALVDKRLAGMEREMSRVSCEKTPHGMISRAVAGTIAESLVVNLPGSPKAVRENLEVVLPAIAHALGKLQGDSSDCGLL